MKQAIIYQSVENERLYRVHVLRMVRLWLRKDCSREGCRDRLCCSSLCFCTAFACNQAGCQLPQPSPLHARVCSRRKAASQLPSAWAGCAERSTALGRPRGSYHCGAHLRRCGAARPHRCRAAMSGCCTGPAARGTPPAPAHPQHTGLPTLLQVLLHACRRLSLHSGGMHADGGRAADNGPWHVNVSRFRPSQ